MRIYGYRTSKTVNGTTTDYTLEGSKVLIEKTGSDYVWYYYDAAGAPVAMATGSGPSLYIYRKNLQGDVTCIYSGSTGTLLVSYVYDAWGKVTATNVANTTESSMVLARNPYLYRGYRYDSETGLYYLNSRYYDPETGRFINADGFVSTGQGILGNNMFAYCENNPVNCIDPFGTWTFGISLSANLNLFFGVSISIGIFFDDKGNVDWQWSYAVPTVNETASIGFLDAGVGLTVQYTNRETVYDLYGSATSIGASVGSSMYAGADLISFSKPNEMDADIDGVQLTFGIGAGVDTHMVVTDTRPVRPRIKSASRGVGISRINLNRNVLLF